MVVSSAEDYDVRLDDLGFTHQRPARSDSLSRNAVQRQRESPAPRFRHNQKEEKHRIEGLRPAGSRPSAAPARFSDPPTRHPHDEPASPARFLLERGSFKRCASIAVTAPAAPSQLAFPKSQADRTAIRTEERRVGKGGFRHVRARWARDYSKKIKKLNT